jgi:hypothetical protein
MIEAIFVMIMVITSFVLGVNLQKIYGNKISITYILKKIKKKLYVKIVQWLNANTAPVGFESECVLTDTDIKTLKMNKTKLY